MGTPLMLQAADAERIETLKRRLGARTKIDVVRSALDLLEREAEKTERGARWGLGDLPEVGDDYAIQPFATQIRRDAHPRHESCVVR